MTNEQTLEFLTTAANQHASDIFIIAGRPLSIKADGHLTDYGERLMPDDTKQILECIYQMANNRDINHLLNTGDDDFSFLSPVFPDSGSTPINSVVHWLLLYV